MAQLQGKLLGLNLASVDSGSLLAQKMQGGNSHAQHRAQQRSRADPALCLRRSTSRTPSTCGTTSPRSGKRCGRLLDNALLGACVSKRIFVDTVPWLPQAVPPPPLDTFKPKVKEKGAAEAGKEAGKKTNKENAAAGEAKAKEKAKAASAALPAPAKPKCAVACTGLMCSSDTGSGHAC